MMYVFADANIFVRIITQGRPGCELSHFEDLVTLAEGDVVRVLVSEVLLLELEKQFCQLPQDFRSNCDRLKASLTKATENVWNEIDALKAMLLDVINTHINAKVGDCEKEAPRIMSFLRSASIKFIPLTHDIWLNTQKRRIAARLPQTKKSSDQDAAMVESLVSFFREAHDDQARLIFCSENHCDFAVECGGKGKDMVFALHPLIQSNLPPATYCVSLEKAMRFARGYESLPEINDKQIQNAADRRDMHDDQEDEYWALHRIVEELAEKKSADQFKDEVLPTLPNDVKQVRTKLAGEIVELLRQCRACSTWDERSEYKLPQWVEYVPENMIPYTALPKLVRIKANLEEYLRRHQSLSTEVASET